MALGSLLLAPSPLLACATCFGKSDSPLAKGMNMGILSLLGFITAVLLAVAGFFVFLARKSAAVSVRPSSDTPLVTALQHD
jgi:hypothetical protein